MCSLLVAIAGGLYWGGEFGVLVQPGQTTAQWFPREESWRSANPENIADVRSALITGLERLPPSFEGTLPDGGWSLDEAGHLQMTAAIKDRFDYFLLAIGEEPLESLIERVQAYIRFSLPAPARDEALALFEDYIALQQALAELSEPPDSVSAADLDAMAFHLQQVSDIRRSYLSPEAADAFFGEDEAYDRYTLDLLRMNLRTDLSDEERKQHQAALASTLPAHLQVAIQQPQQAIQLARLTHALREDGATEDEVYQMRLDQVGAAAAERLRQLDRARQLWQSRVDVWMAERASILESGGEGFVSLSAQLEQSRGTHFDPQERQRVLALERIADRSSE